MQVIPTIVEIKFPRLWILVLSINRSVALSLSFVDRKQNDKVNIVMIERYTFVITH